jgi:hypothetical protein
MSTVVGMKHEYPHDSADAAADSASLAGVMLWKFLFKQESKKVLSLIVFEDRLTKLFLFYRNIFKK